MPTTLATTPAAVVTDAHVEASTKAVTPFGDRQSYVPRQPEIAPLAPATMASGTASPVSREPKAPPSAAPAAPAVSASAMRPDLTGCGAWRAGAASPGRARRS